MSKYSSYLSKIKPLLEELISELSKKYKFASVLGSDVKGRQIRVSKTQTGIGQPLQNERGFVVRIHNGLNYAEYSFNEISKELIPTIIKHIEDNLLINESFKNAKNISLKEYELLNEESLKQDFERDSNKDKEYTNEEIVKVLNETVSDACNNSLIVNCIAIYVQADISKVYISNKKNLTQFYTWTNSVVYPIASDNEKTNYFYHSYSGVKTSDAINSYKELSKEAIKNAIDLLHSVPPTPGCYEVITAPDITGLIAHEAFGHGVEMDMFVKHRAKAVEFINKRVASDIVTMHEAAKGNEECSSYFFDDEGVLAHDTIEIQNGILKTGVCDSISALFLGIEPTGNGKRESFERKAYTRMTSTYFESGNSSLEEMIASIKHGYFITGMFSGMEDPKNWGIQCATALGREIIDGKFSGKVISPVMMTGYVPDLLCSISMASKVSELHGSGTCGKGYKEWVKTADGGPYLKAKVNIG